MPNQPINDTSNSIDNRTTRPISFILASTHTGTMILNRQDYTSNANGEYFGVGYQYLTTSEFDQHEINLALQLLRLRRQYYGDGVQALDCGANIGAHSIAWGNEMTHWGNVLSFEAQERIYYALAGNIAINNCFNVRALNVALGDDSQEKFLFIPKLDYNQHASFGSFELKQLARSEFIGQNIDYQHTEKIKVPLLSLDSLELQRLDFIKMDVEGMEEEVLKSGLNLIKRFKPIMLVEILKTGLQPVNNLLIPLGYRIFSQGINILAVHEQDPVLKHITVNSK
ncbi:FkbM family methyltransferase [Lonepinella koalarum]|uniref:FkbM family methyltransferase n=1 Tax=Lonepinella koalarum TaxID=53417 RepID=UPI003F6DE709